MLYDLHVQLSYELAKPTRSASTARTCHLERTGHRCSPETITPILTAKGLQFTAADMVNGLRFKLGFHWIASELRSVTGM